MKEQNEMYLHAEILFCKNLSMFKSHVKIDHLLNSNTCIQEST